MTDAEAEHLLACQLAVANAQEQVDIANARLDLLQRMLMPSDRARAGASTDAGADRQGETLAGRTQAADQTFSGDAA